MIVCGSISKRVACLPSDAPIRRLEDILANIRRIERYTKGYDFERFSSDLQCQDAVERCLARISEAAKKLEGTLESLAPDQPWSDIRGLGNVLRHEYNGVYPDRIWEIVSSELASLKRAVETIIRNSRPGESA
jgi:uncharacterized protein with HEPN domain